MLGKLIIKLAFSSYNKKVIKLKLSDLTEFQKAALFTRYYLPKLKFLISLKNREFLAGKKISLEIDDQLHGLCAKGLKDLNELCECQEYNFDHFVGLKLDRQVGKKLLKFIFGLLTNLLTKLVSLLELSFRCIKKKLLKVRTN